MAKKKDPIAKAAEKAALARIKDGTIKEKDKESYIRGYCRKPSSV